MRAFHHLIQVTVTAILLLSMLWTALPSTASAKGVVGLQHTWLYTYSARTNQVALSVTINEWNPNSGQIIRRLGRFGYTFKCNESNGYVTCDMDIQSSIEDAYDRVGYPQNVPDAEVYDLLIAEATGTWDKNRFSGYAGLAGHSTLNFGFKEMSSNISFHSWSNAANTPYDSAAFKPAPGGRYVMGATIARVQNNMGGESFYIKHNGQHTKLNEVRYDAYSGFELSANQLQITPVDGFELESLVGRSQKFGSWWLDSKAIYGVCCCKSLNRT